MDLSSRRLGLTVLCGCILSAFWIIYLLGKEERISAIKIIHGSPRSYEYEGYAKQREPEYPQLVICAKIGNELAYLVEWLEFHWIQGVRKVDLYVDDIVADKNARLNMDQIRILVDHYARSSNRVDFVQVYSVSSLLGDDWLEVSDPELYPSVTAAMHRLTQQMSVKQCFEHHKSHSEWILSLDVDEFLYSPTNKTVLEYLNSLIDSNDSIGKAFQKGELAGILVFPVIYGLGNGPFNSPRVATIETLQDGSTSMIFDPRQGPDSNGVNMSRLLAFSLREGDISQEALTEILTDNNRHPDESWVNFTINQLFNNERFASLWRTETQKKLSTVYRAELVQQFEEIISASCPEAYPLIIEQQTKRMPVLELEGFDSVSAAILEYEPKCAEFVEQLRRPHNSHLRGRGDRGEMLGQLGSPPLSECVPGELPIDVTNIGKTLIWTGRSKALNISNSASPAGGSVHGSSTVLLGEEGIAPRLCLVPSIHTCSHRTHFPILTADMRTQLRIDHHILRSADRRITGEKSWKIWNSKKLHWALSFANQIQDVSKVRFAGKIRQALHKLSMKCRSSELFFAPNREPVIEWFASQCDLGALLLRKQTMCPPDFPFAGFHQTLVPPPWVTYPMGWCTNQSISSHIYEDFIHENWPPLQCRHSSDPIANDTDTSCSSWKRQVSSNYTITNVVMCPGSPLTPCCDYSADLENLLQRWFSVIGLSKAYTSMMNRDLNYSSWHLLPHISS